MKNMRNWKFLAIVIALVPSLAYAQANGQFNNISAKSTSLPNWTDPLAFGAKCDGAMAIFKNASSGGRSNRLDIPIQPVVNSVILNHLC
jgi:hypothetical protein